MFYTPSQVSEMLQMPASTLRYYARRFKDQLSDQGNRKQRLYSDQDVKTLGIIHDLSAANVPLHVIEHRLHLNQPQEESRTIENSLALVPAIAAEIANAQESAHLAQIAAEHLREQIEEQSKLIALQKEQLDQQGNSLASVVDQLAQQKAQLNQIERWSSIPWYKRIFKSRISLNTDKID